METEREVRRSNFAQDLKSDLLLALRGMRRTPVFGDPKTDFIFQRVFGSEDHKTALLGFLNDIPILWTVVVVIALVGAIYYLAVGRTKAFAPVTAPARKV